MTFRSARGDTLNLNTARSFLSHTVMTKGDYIRDDRALPHSASKILREILMEILQEIFKYQNRFRMDIFHYKF
jgi:hypothetical protein